MLLNRRLRYRPQAYTDDHRLYHATIPVGIPARLPGIVLETVARNHLNYRVGKDAVFIKDNNNQLKIAVEPKIVSPFRILGIDSREIMYVGKLEQQF